MSDQDEDGFELYWEELGVKTKKTSPEDLRKQLAPEATRNDLVIGSQGNLLVVIHPDGSLEYGPTYSPDEAAMTFWEAMARRRADYEQRMLIFAHMDALLTRIGTRDMECERLRIAAQEEGLPDTEKAQREQYAELAMRRLEMEVHQAIELGRALVERNRVDPGEPGS